MQNLITNQFTVADWTAIDGAVTTIETTIKNKVASLSPNERSEYGKLGDHYMGAADEMHDNLVSSPSLTPDSDTFNLVAFNSDYDTIGAIDLRLSRLHSIVQQLHDTQILHKNDVFSDLLVYYGYIQSQAKNNKPGATTIYEKIARFFKKGKRHPVTIAPPTS